ncbi:MAG: serine/threonine-protein kinase, partial [Gemmataceae bacterium]
MTNDPLQPLEPTQASDQNSSLPSSEESYPPLPFAGETSPRYQPIHLHARGGLGEVFLAHDQELNRDVALKRMQEHVACNPELRQRFQLEAEVTGRLEHPGIVPVYGMGSLADGSPFYAMRFIRGESLQEALQRFHDVDQAGGRSPGERSLALRHLLGRFVSVCNAVAYAHSRGIIHRDLKPANVMLDTYGETLVVDWGLARPVERTESDRSRGEETLQPRSGIQPGTTHGVVGTPSYMSPEQASGRQSLVGPTSDIYSLGAMLYTILVGKPPFDEPTVDQTLEKVQRGEMVRPRIRKSSVPGALEAICLKAMALRREDRYQQVADLSAEVERWLADEPVLAYKASIGERLHRWARHHRVTVGVGLTLLLGSIAALGIGLGLVRQEQQQTE